MGLSLAKACRHVGISRQAYYKQVWAEGACRERDERVVRVEGPPSGPFVAAEGQRIVWVLEFEKPMHASAVSGTVPGIQFTFRGQQLMARWSGGSGTNRLEYAYVFTAQQAGAGMLEPPTHACLCFGGLITDPAGNKIRKHELPAIAAA